MKHLVPRGAGAERRARRVSAIPFVLLGTTATAIGCQLLYDKNELTVGTGGGGATTSTSTTSSGGTGGTTTTGGTTSSGGTGGTTTTGGGGATGGTTSSGGTGGSTGGTGGVTMTGGGGTGGTTTTTTLCPDPLMLVATSPSKVACATYKDEGPWVVTPYPSASSSLRPSASMIDGSSGIGAFYQSAGASGPVRAVVVKSSVCAGVEDVTAAPKMATTKAAPTTTTHDNKVKILFRGDGGVGLDRPILWSWSPAGSWAEELSPIPGVLLPLTPAIALNGTGFAANGAEMLMAHGGYNNNDLWVGRTSGGAWQMETSIAGAINAALRAEVAPLAAGKWLVVLLPTSGSVIQWTVTDGATLPATAPIGGSDAAPDGMSLVATPSGAVLAYRKTNNLIATASFDAAGNAWTALPAIPGAPATNAAPALAKGLCTHTAELVFIDAADGLLKHTSLEGGTWATPAVVDATLMGMTNVAIAGSK